jgi:hypothetical protein
MKVMEKASNAYTFSSEDNGRGNRFRMPGERFLIIMHAMLPPKKTKWKAKVKLCPWSAVSRPLFRYPCLNLAALKLC